MTLFRSSSGALPRGLGLPSRLPEGILLGAWQLRSEESYDNDPHPERTALKLIHHFNVNFNRSAYLLIADSEAAKLSNLRQKKFELKVRHLFKGHKLAIFRRSFSDDVVRFGSIIRLKDFYLESADGIMLNFAYNLMILSVDNINDIIEYASNWLSTSNSVFGIDINSVAVGLSTRVGTTAIRYSPAENGNPEMIYAFVNSELDYKKCDIALSKASKATGFAAHK